MNNQPGHRTGEERLRSLLDRVASGAIQVPVFQRPITLTDAWIRSLLASVSLGYPIGAVMLLSPDTDAYDIPFRAVVGAPPAHSKPNELLVDGQHRISALFQALVSDAGVVVHDKVGEEPRVYCLAVRAAVDPKIDRDDAVVSEPAGAANTPPDWFPLRLVFGTATQREHWRESFLRGRRGDEAAVLERFEADVLAGFDGYALPVIYLDESLTRWTIRVRGGVQGPALSEQLRVRVDSAPNDQS